MGYYLPTGTTVDIATSLATAINTTALTNAVEAVATTATQTYANGDFLVIASGWNPLNERVVRVKAVSATAFTAESIDTASTTRYPAGAGTGSSRKVTAWTRIPQVLNVETSGGEQNFEEFRFLEEDFQRREPTFKSALGYTMTIADDIVAPSWLPLVRAANDSRASTPLRLILPKGGVLVANGIWSLMETPNLSSGGPASLRIDVSLTSQPTRYYS